MRVLVTPAAAGVVVALDGAALMIASDPIAVATAAHASIDLDNGSPALPISLWQRNLAGVRAEQLVRYTIAPGSVAFASVESSPA